MNCKGYHFDPRVFVAKMFFVFFCVQKKEVLQRLDAVSYYDLLYVDTSPC